MNQRFAVEERSDVLHRRMLETDFNVEVYKWYLDL